MIFRFFFFLVMKLKVHVQTQTRQDLSEKYLAMNYWFLERTGTESVKAQNLTAAASI